MTDMACQFMTFEVRDIVNHCSVDPSISAVVLTGTGKHRSSQRSSASRAAATGDRQ
jgi:enoyl-CoA hydratase/carnithine racemase